MPPTDMKVYMANRRLKRRQMVFDHLGNRCNRCDSDNELEVNHIDRTKKNFGLSGAGLDKAWAKILEELENCELLCRSCHLDYTASQYKAGKILAWNKGINGEFEHGTARMYQEKKCKCEPCKRAKRVYRTGTIGYNEKVT